MRALFLEKRGRPVIDISYYFSVVEPSCESHLSNFHYLGRDLDSMCDYRKWEPVFEMLYFEVLNLLSTGLVCQKAGVLGQHCEKVHHKSTDLSFDFPRDATTSSMTFSNDSISSQYLAMLFRPRSSSSLVNDSYSFKGIKAATALPLRLIT